MDEDQESAASEAEEDDDEDTSEDDSEDALEDGALGGKTSESQLEVISDYESDEGNDDETEYSSWRARPRDNTTGVSRQILVSKNISQTRRELSKVQQEFLDDKGEGDVSIVAVGGRLGRELWVGKSVLASETPPHGSIRTPLIAL